MNTKAALKSQQIIEKIINAGHYQQLKPQIDELIQLEEGIKKNEIILADLKKEVQRLERKVNYNLSNRIHRALSKDTSTSDLAIYKN